MGVDEKSCSPTESAPVVRKYDIGGTTYIVKAAVKDGATEDAVVKVRRLIKKEITREKCENSGEN